MEDRKFSLQYKAVTANELTAGDRKLMEQAQTAIVNAYAPYSKFPVGAALRLENGQVITGNNQENASFPNGICGERVAMFAAAAAHPNVAFDTLAIVTKSEQPVASCGMCRQAMAEYAKRFGKPFRLILGGSGSEVLVFEDASVLLPLSFSRGDLK